MRLFKTLLHNCLHDLRKNLKQLIAIIFIIGIAITLFTGLSANSIEFENEVLKLHEIMIPPLMSSVMSSEQILGK